MMQKEPQLRMSAEEYLVQQRGRAFPEYFYTFLKLYLQRFATAPILPSDDRIARWNLKPYSNRQHRKKHFQLLDPLV